MKRIFISTLLLLCCLPAYGAEKSHYIDPALFSPEFIPAPPTDLKAKIEEIIKRQSQATDADKTAAIDEAHMRPEMMATNINREHFPKTLALLDNVNQDCGAVIGPSKNYWNTDRPYAVDKRIIPLGSMPNNASYPSGHTACSRLWAEVLGQLSPSKRSNFRARAAAIADHRLVAGLHWPHDLIGGEQTALIIFGAMQTSPAYQNDLAEAKKEWK